jgi:hypothetical protein
MDAAGLAESASELAGVSAAFWRALPTSPWKTGQRRPISHSAHRPRRQSVHPSVIGVLI